MTQSMAGAASGSARLDGGTCTALHVCGCLLYTVERLSLQSGCCSWRPYLRLENLHTGA